MFLWQNIQSLDINSQMKMSQWMAIFESYIQFELRPYQIAELLSCNSFAC